MKLTNNEQWVLDYLKGKDYVSPTEIGKIHALAVGSYSFTHHSAWASPICLRISSISSKLSINTPNYERWLDGCLRKTEENIAALEAGLERVSEAKRMLQEEIVKQEEFDVLWSGIINY